MHGRTIHNIAKYVGAMPQTTTPESGFRKEPLQPGGFLMSHTLCAERSKPFGREGGHRTGQSFISIFFHNIFKFFIFIF